MEGFDLATMDAQDEAELVIRHPKTLEPTGWIWTFYGPGHAVTTALSNRVAGVALKKAAARRQAQVNGKKWKEDEESLDQLRADQVDGIVTRTKGFTPIKLDGADDRVQPRRRKGVAARSPQGLAARADLGISPG